MFEYLWFVWRAIRMGLSLQPEVVQAAESYPNATWIAFGVVMVAGISLLLGQSVILFLNQVRPGPFVLSLVLHGLVLVGSWIVWSAVVWLIGSRLFEASPRFVMMLRVIGLSYAPLAFGFLILMPYLGPFVHRLLNAWAFIIALRAVAYTFAVGYWPALVCVGAGWLMLMALTATIGRPAVALQNWAWQRITGAPLNASTQEMLQQFALREALQHRPGGDPP